AGFEYDIVLGRELAEYLQGQAGLQRQVLLASVAPAAAACRLQQEHVVAVEVRPHAAAIGGHADHDVIEPGVGNETELLQQGRGGIAVQVYALHQQGPVGFGCLGQARKGALFHLPGAVFAPDQARFDVVAARQLLERGDVQRRLEAGDGLPDQQGLALPVAAHEVRGAEPAQQRQGQVDFHGMQAFRRYRASSASRGVRLSGSIWASSSRRACRAAASPDWSLAAPAWASASMAAANRPSCGVGAPCASRRSSSRDAWRMTAAGTPARCATWLP